MWLDRGNVKGFEHDRMVMLFSMMDSDKEIGCAVPSGVGLGPSLGGSARTGVF
jgi:hypothetical protein